MTATLARDGRVPAGDGWLYERKLDGVRLVSYVGASETRLLSRNRIRQEDTYPEVADSLLEGLAVDAVVDGEVVALDGDRTSFGRLQQRMHVHDEARSRRSQVRVTYFAFDLLWVAGQDARSLPFTDRRALLGQVLDVDDIVRISPVLEGEPDVLLDRARAQGWEGLIAKRAASTYQGRRSRDWSKLKVSIEQEMVVVGFTEPTGSRAGLGALLLGYHEGGGLRYGGKVGTGFSHDLLRSLRAQLEAMEVDTPSVVDPPRERGAHWVRPELVAQVAFGEWTGDGHLRHPRFRGLRTDKDPADVIRE